MTYKDKVLREYPEAADDTKPGGVKGCPSTYGYDNEPKCAGNERHYAWPANCRACWNREIPEEIDSPSLTCYEAGKEIYAAFLQGIKDVGASGEPGIMGVIRENMEKEATRAGITEHQEHLPHILDSGNRREFGTGAVRDIQEGKGRCDLMPLDVISRFLKKAYDEYNDTHTSIVFKLLYDFQSTGDVSYLYDVLLYTDRFDGNIFTMLLEVSKHFEEGAKKYGELNWRFGIPAKCYLDSAVRHYLKYLREDTDEPHDRAFVWNLMCCIWTCEHKPELNTYAGDNNA